MQLQKEDLRILNEAYELIIDDQGFLWGLTAGDQHYEKTSIKVNFGANILNLVRDSIPGNPYPEDIFPMTIQDYAKAVPDPNLRTAISGCIGRYMYDTTVKTILETLKNEFADEV